MNTKKEKNETRGRFTEIPLYLYLVVSFVLQITIVVGLVSFISFRNGQRAVNNVADQLRNEITLHIKEQLYTFLETPHKINKINAAAIQNGRLDPNDADALEHYFWDQVQVFDSVSSIYFGNTEGGLVDAGREFGEETFYVIQTDDFISGQFNKYATDDHGNRTDLMLTFPGFDARSRPWYTNAVEKETATWSEIYILFSEQDMTISASHPVFDNGQKLLGVVSSDIFVSKISAFLYNLKIGETGLGFIVDRDGLLIASSIDEKLLTDQDGDEEQKRLSATESSIPVIHNASEFLINQFGDYDNITGEKRLEFDFDGQRQFMQVSQVQDEYGIDWLVIVIIPESDFLKQINTTYLATALLTILVLVIAILMGITTNRLVTRPILRLVASTQALTEGEWDQVVPTGWIKELGKLARSFNDMAGQLKQTVANLKSEITRRKKVELKIQRLNEELEGRVKLRTAQLEEANRELESFAYSVSHDLRAPLRAIEGFSQILKNEHFTSLPSEAQHYLELVRNNTTEMDQLIDDLLAFSRLAGQEPARQIIAPNEVVKRVLEDLQGDMAGRSVELKIADMPDCLADPALLKQVYINLLDNAIKFTRNNDSAKIEIGYIELDGEQVYFVKDNGVGFDMQYKDKLFGVFQRLHLAEEFEGTGVGLAIVLRIIRRHGGRVWAESEVDQGATFYFSLEGEIDHE